MKILIQNRRDHFLRLGGDVVQIEKTKKFLEEKYDVEVDISTEFNLDLSDYDIVHLFNITRVHETVLFLENAKKQNIPVALTPIFHDLEAINKYENLGRYGFIKVLNKICTNQTIREFFKNISKAAFDKDFKQIYPIFKQLFQGYEAQQKFVVENSDIIFPIAQSEYNTMIEQLGIYLEKKYILTPNGIELKEKRKREVVHIENIDFNNDKWVISSGRIEPRKNQISLINALKDTNIKILFVGELNKKHKKYCREFLKLIDMSDHVFLGKVTHDQMLELFEIAKVSVLTSWFEVTSLVDLEAYLSGSNIVTTKHSFISDYLENEAIYIDPANINEIKAAVMKSLKCNERNEKLVEEKRTMVQKFTWDYTASKVYEGYQLIKNC